MEKLYTVKEATEILKISRATLYRHIKNGLLKPIKLGGKTLFLESELNNFIEKLKQSAERSNY